MFAWRVATDFAAIALRSAGVLSIISRTALGLHFAQVHSYISYPVPIASSNHYLQVLNQNASLCFVT
jgi:hypothetical protein